MRKYSFIALVALLLTAGYADAFVGRTRIVIRQPVVANRIVIRGNFGSIGASRIGVNVGYTGFGRANFGYGVGTNFGYSSYGAGPMFVDPGFNPYVGGGCQNGGGTSASVRIRVGY